MTSTYDCSWCGHTHDTGRGCPAFAARPKPVRHQGTEASPDPWAEVETHLADLVQPETGLVRLATPVYIAEDVDRARAAVEAQHQQEIETLTQERDALAAQIAGLREKVGTIKQGLFYWLPLETWERVCVDLDALAASAPEGGSHG